MTLTNEQVFLQVVESGSLKKAGDVISIDPSVVSRKIAALEKRLGVKLLMRSTKRSTPTEAGVIYYRQLREIVDQQAALEANIAGLSEHPQGKLTVAAPVDFGARFVTPVLSALQAEFPNLSIELLLGSAFSNLNEEGIDVAVRIGQLADSSLIASRLGRVPRVVVGARDYFTTRALPANPCDLEDHPFVFYLPGQQQEAITLEKGGIKSTVTVQGTFSANSITSIRSLVMQQRGLHHGPVWAFEDELDAGSAIALLPRYTLKSFPVQAVYVSRRYVPAKVKVFILRLRQALIESTSILTD